jgi:hypothetical protein
MYTSLIEDCELIQGDSSPIYFLGSKDSRTLDSNWSAKYTIRQDYNSAALVERILPLNSGLGEGDKYTEGTKFVFQIYPSESSILTVGEKYYVGVEIKNSSIPYRQEVAQFRVKVRASLVEDSSLPT